MILEIKKQSCRVENISINKHYIFMNFRSKSAKQKKKKT